MSTEPDPAEEPAPTATVHCVFCPRTVVGVPPEDAHDRMEAHYSAVHSAHMDALGYPDIPRGRAGRRRAQGTRPARNGEATDHAS